MNISQLKVRTAQIYRHPTSQSIRRVAKSAVPIAAAYVAGSEMYTYCPEFHALADKTRAVMNEFPTASRLLSAGLITGAFPSFFAQRFAGGKFNYRRFASEVFTCALLCGPVLGKFYSWVNEFIPGKDFWHVEARIAIDQLNYSPANLVIYLSLNTLLQGKSWTGFGHQVRNDVNQIIPKSWVFWGLFGCQIIQRADLDLQSYIANVLCIIWYSWLSNRTQNHNAQFACN